MKHTCVCGRKMIEFKSYFHKESGIRVTVCDTCAENLGLKDKESYDSINYKELSEWDKKTPLQDADRP